MEIAVIGSGPAGLMAASVLADAGHSVHLFEKRPALGRKLLIAGSSGLNISHEATSEEWVKYYSGFDSSFWSQLFLTFSPSDWIQFIETKLRLETFLGTSRRYFVREMKASGLLKRWQERLLSQGTKIYSGHELVDFESSKGGVTLSFHTASEKFTHFFDRAIFALGGASWESETPAFFELFQKKGLKMEPFQASNVGYELDWKPAFLKEAEGKPLKKVILKSRLGSKAGELMVTNYGLEGTPIYFYGTEGSIYLDLKPDETEEELLKKLSQVKENLSPMRRVKKVSGLGEAALALIFHHGSEAAKNDLKLMVKEIKKFKLTLVRARPLLESISSKGGLSLTELNEKLELKKFPHLFCAGEMLDWDAPTGGFLIQASVSQGVFAARNALKT